MKSWQTKLAGGLAALGYWMSLQSDPWWLHKIGEGMVVFGLAYSGVVTRQNNVPSEAIPKAAERADELKRDTEFLNRMKGN